MRDHNFSLIIIVIALSTFDKLRTLDGLLSDLDGTLINSSDVIVRAWATIALKHEMDINQILLYKVCPRWGRYHFKV